MAHGILPKHSHPLQISILPAKLPLEHHGRPPRPRPRLLLAPKEREVEGRPRVQPAQRDVQALLLRERDEKRAVVGRDLRAARVVKAGLEGRDGGEAGVGGGEGCRRGGAEGAGAGEVPVCEAVMALGVRLADVNVGDCELLARVDCAGGDGGDGCVEGTVEDAESRRGVDKG